MFGKRSGLDEALLEHPVVAELQRSVRRILEPVNNNSPTAAMAKKTQPDRKTDEYHDLKTQVFAALIEIIDVSQLAQMDVYQARAEIREVVAEVVTAKKVVISTAEQEQLLEDICNDVLGYGPLEPLLARDDITDIMVNGSGRIFIEVGGKVQETDIRFRDNTQLLNVCQR